MSVKSRSLAALALLSVLLAVAAASAGVGFPGASGTVFVTERQLGSVAAFDAASGEVLWVSKVGAAPIGVTQPRGIHKVYSSDEGSNQMSILDQRTGALLGTIPMGPLPHHLLASANGNFIYVGEFGHNEVGIVDTCRDERVAGYIANPDPLARTHAVWITRNGKDLYATNSRVDRSQQGDVAHIDARTGELLCNTLVGADPSEILATRDGKTGYVSVRRENKVKELDLRHDCPALTGREAQIGTMPDTLRLTNDEQTLVVTLRGTPAQISLMDTDTFEVQIVDIPGHTLAGHHWLSANSRYTFVAVENPGALAVVDNRLRQVVDEYPYPTPPGGSRPHGVFYVSRELRSDDDDRGDDDDDDGGDDER